MSDQEEFDDLVRDIEQMSPAQKTALLHKLQERQAIKDKYNISDEDWDKL
jgi:hypothetical protein